MLDTESKKDLVNIKKLVNKTAQYVSIELAYKNQFLDKKTTLLVIQLIQNKDELTEHRIYGFI